MVSCITCLNQGIKSSIFVRNLFYHLVFFNAEILFFNCICSWYLSLHILENMYHLELLHFLIDHELKFMKFASSMCL